MARRSFEAFFTRVPVTVLFDGLSIPLVVLSSAGVVVKANDAMCELVGLESDEVRGRRIEWLILDEADPNEETFPWLCRLAGRIVFLRHRGVSRVHAYLSRPLILAEDAEFAVVAFEDASEPM